MNLGEREQIRRAVALAQLPETVEEGLIQLQLRTMECAAWLEMAAVYDGMLEIFEAAAAMEASGQPRSVPLLDRLRRDRGELERTRPDVEWHHRSYADAYEKSRHALHVPRRHPSMAERIALLPATTRQAEAVRVLQRVLAMRFAGFAFGDERAVEAIVELLFHYLLAEQGIVAVATAAAAELRPGEPQSLRHRRPASLLETPDLLHMLEEELAVRVECKASGIDVTDLRTRSTYATP
jgi:hypothetical protein